MRFKGISQTEAATIKAAQHVVDAPPAWIDAEPPYCLLEILDQLTEDLTDMLPMIGLGWKIITIEIMKGKIEKQLELI